MVYVCPQKATYKNVYSTTIKNNPKLENKCPLTVAQRKKCGVQYLQNGWSTAERMNESQLYAIARKSTSNLLLSERTQIQMRTQSLMPFI